MANLFVEFQPLYKSDGNEVFIWGYKSNDFSAEELIGVTNKDKRPAGVSVIIRFKDNVVLYRDWVGTVPLYFSLSDDSRDIFCGRSLKWVAEKSSHICINKKAVVQFLSLNAILSPETIFEKVFQVPGGHIYVFSCKEGKWSLAKDIFYLRDTVLGLEKFLGGFEEAVEELERRLRQVIEKGMSGHDMYFGFLSGGIDSAVISGLASDMFPERVRLFTVGFEGVEDETEDAKLMAKYFGARHDVIKISPESFWKELPRILSEVEMPFMDSSIFPTRMSMEFVRGYTDYVFTGDGPDQLLGGSDKYEQAFRLGIINRGNGQEWRRRVFKWMYKVFGLWEPRPSFVNKVIRKLWRGAFSDVGIIYDLDAICPEMVRFFLLSEDLLSCYDNVYDLVDEVFSEIEGDFVDRWLWADVRLYLQEDILVKVERASRGLGVKLIMPYLDVDVIKLCFSLPSGYKLRLMGNTVCRKCVLRELAKRFLPSEILSRPKRGFSIPLRKYLIADGGKMAKEIILSGSLERIGIKRRALEKMITCFLEGQGDYFYPSEQLIFGLISLGLFLDNVRVL